MTTQPDAATNDFAEDWFEEEESEYDASLPVNAEVPDPASKYASSQLRVVRETKDYQLDYLKHALRPGGDLIDTSPSYQRRSRWTIKKKSLLIESFLLNIPVPPIFLYERDYNAYEVIDGRQRLDAIRAFLVNEFALVGLEYWQELHGLTFEDLSPVLQKGLLRRSLPAVVLLAETAGEDASGVDVRRVLFDRLNTGGAKLNPQELRNALYAGSLNDLLIELARSDSFTASWGIPGREAGGDTDQSHELLKNPMYSSMADVELVLRFVALKDAVANGRTGALRRILDRFMDEGREIAKPAAEELQDDFESCATRLYELFDGRPFRLPTGRTSRPLYDALMIALSLNPYLDLRSNAAAIKTALNNAFSDGAKYEVLVGRGNTIDSVHARVDLAAEILRSETGSI